MVLAQAPEVLKECTAAEITATIMALPTRPATMPQPTSTYASEGTKTPGGNAAFTCRSMQFRRRFHAANHAANEDNMIIERSKTRREAHNAVPMQSTKPNQRAGSSGVLPIIRKAGVGTKLQSRAEMTANMPRTSARPPADAVCSRDICRVRLPCIYRNPFLRDPELSRTVGYQCRKRAIKAGGKIRRRGSHIAPRFAH